MPVQCGLFTKPSPTGLFTKAKKKPDQGEGGEGRWITVNGRHIFISASKDPHPPGQGYVTIDGEYRRIGGTGRPFFPKAPNFPNPASLDITKPGISTIRYATQAFRESSTDPYIGFDHWKDRVAATYARQALSDIHRYGEGVEIRIWRDDKRAIQGLVSYRVRPTHVSIQTLEVDWQNPSAVPSFMALLGEAIKSAYAKKLPVYIRPPKGAESMFRTVGFKERKIGKITDWTLPHDAQESWLKLHESYLKKAQSEEGHWVTINGHPVFIGGLATERSGSREPNSIQEIGESSPQRFLGDVDNWRKPEAKRLARDIIDYRAEKNRVYLYRDKNGKGQGILDAVLHDKVQDLRYKVLFVEALAANKPGVGSILARKALEQAVSLNVAIEFAPADDRVRNYFAKFGAKQTRGGNMRVEVDQAKELLKKLSGSKLQKFVED